MWIVQDILLLLVDVFVVVLPLPSVWGLQITKAEKIGVSAMFLLGGLYVPNVPSEPNEMLTNVKHRRRKPHPPPQTHLHPTQRSDIHGHRRGNLVPGGSLPRYYCRLPPLPAPTSTLAHLPSQRQYAVVIFILATSEE